MTLNSLRCDVDNVPCIVQHAWYNDVTKTYWARAFNGMLIDTGSNLRWEIRGRVQDGKELLDVMEEVITRGRYIENRYKAKFAGVKLPPVGITWSTTTGFNL